MVDFSPFEQERLPAGWTLDLLAEMILGSTARMLARGADGVEKTLLIIQFLPRGLRNVFHENVIGLQRDQQLACQRHFAHDAVGESLDGLFKNVPRQPAVAKLLIPAFDKMLKSEKQFNSRQGGQLITILGAKRLKDAAQIGGRVVRKIEVPTKSRA